MVVVVGFAVVVTAISVKESLITVKILKFRTSKNFDIITLKVEQDDFSLE